MDRGGHLSSQMMNGDSQDGQKAQYGRIEDNRLSAEEMDERRKENIAYVYLCHLEEAKMWIEACIKEPIPPTVELEEGLRNGVVLAKLAHFISPDLVPMKKVYDKDLLRYKARGLHFRHTDNINHWLRSLEEIRLPKIFYPETTDIYERKNMPRVIYCIHALSMYLFKLGRAPQILDLIGKIKFTDEEINAMRRELDKYGIQMPAFSKIGGILANEMPVDQASLHAAVIAINEAIDHESAELTLRSLKNPEAHLTNVSDNLSEFYQSVLYEAKQNKAETARNKSMDPDSSYIPDVYDELLTQAEIQGNINKVNLLYAQAVLNEALEKRDHAALITALKQDTLRLRGVSDEHAQFYMVRLLEAKAKKQNRSEEEEMLTKEEIQMAVNLANEDADEGFQKTVAVKQVNQALESSDPSATLRALQNSRLALPCVLPGAQTLYHEELKNVKAEKQDSLNHEEIAGALEVLNAIAKVNEAIDTGNSALTFKSLCDDCAHMMDVDEGCKEKYQKRLGRLKASKQAGASGGGCLLTHREIQQCISETNQQVMDEHEKITAIGQINEAIDRNNARATLACLKMPSAGLQFVNDKQMVHYQQLLAQIKSEKAEEMNDPTAVLWYEEIQSTIDLANAHAEEGTKMSVCVAAINIAVECDDEHNLLNCLQNTSVRLHGVTSRCIGDYLRHLKAFKEEKEQSGETGSGWMMHKLRDGFRFFFNVNSLTHSWQKTEDVRKDYSLLTRDEIQACIAEVTAAYDRQLLYQMNERFIVLLQARFRGALARRRFHKLKIFYRTRLPAIIKIQSWWRMIRARNSYTDRIEYFRSREDAAVEIQSYVRMYLARTAFLEKLQFFRDRVEAVVKIQAFMRSAWAKQDYKALMHGGNPPISVVRKFVHLLDIGDNDYSEEIELEKLRQQVVTEIRSNQQLEADLNQMDIKIGLLVKNRITLQDVISQNKTLKKHHDSSAALNQGLKSLSKQSRERLEAYQHLFYLLQTNPVYLAKLIFEMPQSRTTKFMESAILTLYNYASNQREEYLLLKLFKTSLEEEIKSKVEKMTDIITGNPMVVKMIVSFNRNGRGQSSLRELLNPLVRSVIEDQHLQINTNAVEVYKQWINQMEAETGRASGLPYETSTEQALEHQEVRDRIQKSLEGLRDATERFLSAILASVEKIPYGMRYMAKVMRNALHEHFPTVPEKETLKIIGNLIYYRYINSAIVAPDAFDIIDVSATKGLTNDQRRNLGSIAKILQFAASNKGFGADSAHLVAMNKYIMEAHTRFKKYFQDICSVEEPEMKFNMDQYSDVSRVTKPVIYISVGEIVEMHKLLLEHQHAVAPDPYDPLHELLDDLGDVRDVDLLIGDSAGDDVGKAQLAKTEISLTLSNKFEVPEDDESDKNNLVLRTKRMLVDVIRCQRTGGDSLVHILRVPATEDEENVHQALIKMRERVDQKALVKQAKLVRHTSILGDTRLPLETMKKKICMHINQLEEMGVVSRKDGYQFLVNSIVQDIRNQRLYRQRRKQEMVRLKVTLKNLSAKRSFFEEQVNYYNQYVKTCLDNQAAKSKKPGKKSAPKHSVKYSAARLYEKGVILDIEGLAHNHFKNVLFEISSTETPGLFDVNAKFMGVSMEKVELLFQNLLELQYEGIAVMKMFDRAQVNVNLLIFLLNKKFFGKK